MRKGRRSAERLSYWPELGSRALTRREQEMPRSFAVNNKSFPMAAEVVISLVLVLLMALTFSTRLQAQGPALTTISGTVYRADGTAALGTVLISWPSFQSAEGDAVAAGNLSVTIGPLGAFTAHLAPNVGASPAGTYYIVVFQLDDGTVRTEYWAVPATSPTTIAAVLTTPGTGLGNLAATDQYVNAAVATRALDATVVHLAGTETITGAKQFAVPPALPAPAGANDAANKGYVDAAVANVGAGSFVAKAGDTMSGPLTLPADPTAPNQAADRHYVDSGLLGKADRVNGMVPPGELGAGVASAATCLNGNSTWGSCGGGAPAGITYATTALNWTQSMSGSVTGGSPGTVVLTPCPVGVDYTSGAGYQVYITDGVSSEAVAVTGGSTGGGNCSITFTPFCSHTSYTIGAASSGIQETVNAGCGVLPTTYWNSQCNITIPANGPYPGSGPIWSLNNYNVYGTIFFHSNQSVLNGPGVSMNCLGRGPCLQVGDQIKSLDYQNNTIQSLAFRSPNNNSANPAYSGCAITQTSAIGTTATITTATACGFRPGDMVTVQFTDDSSYWGDAVVASASGTTFSFVKHYLSTKSSQNTPGVVALAYDAILDNAQNTHFQDIVYDNGGEAGNFSIFFDFWDDENALIEHFNNNGISLVADANWTGAFIYSGGSPIGPGGNPAQQWAPVITLRNSSITANYSNGVTVENSNGLYIENTVLQATGPWQVKSSNENGNYQGTYLKNIYSESSTALNPSSPPRSPFPGLGIAGLIAGVSSGAASFQIAGNGGMSGAFATGGTGSTPYSYFIVANDTTAGTQTSPMQVLNWLSTGSDSIPVRWPRVANGTDNITYDVIRMTTPAGVGAVYPYNGGCVGGTGGTCGYVAKGLLQSGACSGGLVCTYADNGASPTSGYTIKQANYSGVLNFWPGSVVSVNKSVAVDVEQGAVVGVGLNGNPLQIAHQCSGYGAASPGGYTTCLSSLTTANNSVPNQTATILTDGDANTGGTQILTKGRLNFSTTPYTTIQPHHIITLIDSQPALTQATAGYRPLASVNDVWIGTDVAAAGAVLNLGHVAFGAPVSITNYIAQTGDCIHANWLERLSASLKEFNVPVKFDQSVTLAGLSNGCLNIASGVIASSGSPCGSGGGGGGNSVFGRSGAVVAATGAYTVSQVTGAAPLASPTFTGTASGPTANPGDSSTKLATTAFVQSALPANSTTIPWLTFSHGGSNINFSTATNKAIFTGVVLDFAKTASQVSYNVSIADNTSNTYDLGIYSGTSGGTCTQQAHTGPTAGTTFAASTGWKTTSWTGGSVTLQPGRYYLAYTTSCTTSCATLIGDTGGFTFAGSSGGANSNVSVTAGGTLPATATCPSDGYATTSAPNWAIN